MAYNSPDNLASDCIFHHFVPSPPWVTLIISCPTYSCLRTFELAIPSAWKWLRWLRICLQGGKPRFDPWVRRIPWRREWLPIPVFVPGEFHGQMSMVGYSPQSGKEWVTTEANNTFPFTAWKCLQFVSSCRSTFYFPSLLSPSLSPIKTAFFFFPSRVHACVHYLLSASIMRTEFLWSSKSSGILSDVFITAS